MPEKYRSQLRKGFLELCVLVLLENKGRAYGLEILESLRARELEIGEGTLYPLLTRLLKEGKLESVWENPETGHPRKFYTLSDSGKAHSQALEADFVEQQRVYRRIKEA